MASDDDGLAEQFEQLQHNFRLLMREKAAIENEFEEMLVATHEKEQQISQLEEHNKSLSVKAQQLDAEKQRSTQLLESLATAMPQNTAARKSVLRRSRPLSRIFFTDDENGGPPRVIIAHNPDRDLSMQKQLQEARGEISKLRAIIADNDKALLSYQDELEALRHKQRESNQSLFVSEESIALLEELDRFKQRAHAAEEECVALRLALDQETVRLQDELDETLAELEATRLERDQIKARRQRGGQTAAGETEEEILEYEYEFESPSLDGDYTRVNTRKGCTYKEQQQLFNDLMSQKWKLAETEEAVLMEQRLKEQVIAYSAKRDDTVIAALRRPNFSLQQREVLAKHLEQTRLATAFAVESMPDAAIKLPEEEEKVPLLRRWMNKLKGASN